MGWRIEITGFEELIKALDRIDDTLSKQVTRQCVKAAGEVVAARAKQLCPVGNPADKADLKPLRDTIGVEVRNYDRRALAVVGPEYPAGAHGHLVEYGHAEVLWGVRTGRRVPAKPFMRPAFDETQTAQKAAMEDVVAAAIRELGI